MLPMHPDNAKSSEGGALGRLVRLFGDWSARHQRNDQVATALTPDIDPRLSACADKICTAATAVSHIRAGDHVFVGTACATPRSLVAALEAQKAAPTDVELVHFLTDRAIQHDADGAPQTRYRHRSFFVGQDMRQSVRSGGADYVPISIARVPHLISTGCITVDVALIQVSMPDEFGYVSLGISVDIISAAVAKARLVIAEVNPAMPRTMGDSSLHISEIHHLVPVDTPVIEYLHHAPQEEVVEQIARYISSIIDDGSTLQIGMGHFSNEALKYLADRQDLGIHSDVITDAIIPLLEKGILTGKRKSHQPGKIVTSFAMGSRRLYDLIDRNPLFSFQAIDTVCDAYTIARQHKMVSVTQAFAVDLTGQVCVDQFDGNFYSGMAAQGEFLQGASRSLGGKAIICLASTDATARISRIRPVLQSGEGVAVTRADVHYVITEYGIAYLFGRSIRERAIAMIQIAHPDHRLALHEQAKAIGYLPTEQQLRNLHAYAVKEERRVALKDKREVLIRPAVAGDAGEVRNLFHQLPAHDIFTRFFYKVKGLSAKDVQRLCNVNFETEVAMVAVTGTRENPQIIAHSLYVVDTSTNLAETAFMVHPQWQGQGLGGHLQLRMQAHAVEKGVRGFVAEILPENRKMMQLARGASKNSKVTHMGDTVRVTTLF